MISRHPRGGQIPAWPLCRAALRLRRPTALTVLRPCPALLHTHSVSHRGRIDGELTGRSNRAFDNANSLRSTFYALSIQCVLANSYDVLRTV